MLRPGISFAVLLALATSSGGWSQTSATIFEPTGQFQLVVEGSLDPKADVFQARSGRGVLVVSDRLPSPVILVPGIGSVQAVPLMRLVPGQGGRVSLLRGDELRSLGTFRPSKDGISFAHGSVSAVLQAKQPLVGEHQPSELFEHSPDYRVKADAYRPDRNVVAKLQGVGEGYRVRVVFGSWCHVCKNFLPRGLKVHEELADSAIQFEYYGLPQSPWDPPHPEVKRLKIQSLPTAIVYRGEKEIGRYAGGDEWQRPESRIWAAISSSR